MGFIDSFKNVFTKDARQDVNLTNINKWTDFSNLISSENFLEQYFGWTYVASSYTAEAVGRQEIYLVDNTGERLEVEKNNIWRDLKRFNEYQTLYDGRVITQLHLSLTGQAYWYMPDREDGVRGKEFFVLNPEKISATLDKRNGLPIGYKYVDVEGKITNFQADEVIHFRLPNPISPLKGYGPLQGSKYPHNTWEAYSNFNFNFMMNNARPNGMIFVDADEPTTRRFEKELRSKYMGTKRAGRTAVMNKKLEFIEWQHTAKDMQFQESLEQMARDILAMHKVPADLVKGGGTFNNVEEAQIVFQTYNTDVRLSQEEAVLNEQLVVKYMGKEGASFKFSYVSPIAKDKDKEVGRSVSLYAAGIITKNEARELVELEEIEGGSGFVEVETRQRFPFPQPTGDEKKINAVLDEVREMKKESKELTKEVKEVFSEENARDQIKKKALKENLSGEVKMLSGFQGYFNEQEKNIFPKNENPEKKITIKQQGLDPAQETTAGIEILSPTYEGAARDFNLFASDLMDDNRALDSDDFKLLKSQLGQSIREINDTSQKELSKLIAENVQSGASLRDLKQSVIDYYDQVISGQANVNVLKDNGVWEERSEVNIEGDIVKGSSNRYNKMLENISRMQDKAKQLQSAQALVNSLDYSDPLATGIEQTAEIFYNVKPQEGINESRAKTIARTESNKLKNGVSRIRYDASPVVDGYEWLSASDSFVRDAHAAADGQVVRKGEKFYVGGEELAFPGDPRGSAGNVVNCRCTIIPVVK